MAELQPFKHVYDMKRGTIVYREEQAPKGVYFIRSGLMKLEKKGTHERSVILKISGQGQSLGYHCIESGDVHSSTAVTIEDSRCCFLEIDAFRKAVRQSDTFRMAVRRMILDDTRELETKIALMTYRQVREKVADALLYIAKRYGYKPDGDGIRVNVDRQEIADMVGTTKEQVSKTLAEFTKLGLIRCRAKHFKFIDREGLTAFVNGVLGYPPVMTIQPQSRA
jgi:CRP/FNR family transcriptional regulator, polysaccharide utilization system transcription regulator